MDAALQNLRYALRQLARNPGFTLTVLLTLALSIGANTAIFSLVNALLIKSLPYPHPERLGALYARTTGPDGLDQRKNLDGTDWEALRDNVPALISAITAGLSSGVNLQSGNGASTQVQYLHGGRVSAHYLDVLGIQPLIGRNFTAEEDMPHGPRSTILSYSLWRTTFASAPTLRSSASPSSSKASPTRSSASSRSRPSPRSTPISTPPSSPAAPAKAAALTLKA
jgi:hypothetical protein